MFKIDPNPTFSSKVYLSIPGEPNPVDVDMVFKHKNSEQIEDWLSRMKNGQGDVNSLSEVIDSWSGIVDKTGNQVEFSVGALGNLLLAYPAASGEILRGYLKELTGSKAKN